MTSNRPLRFLLALALGIIGGALGSACSAGGGVSGLGVGASGGAAATRSTGTGAGGGLSVQLVSSSDAGAGYTTPEGGRVARCTDAGCTCVRIASIGHEGIWGGCGMYSDSTSAFVGWLNTQSTATVDMYTAKPTLTADFLAQYDVIIVQWLKDVPDGGNGGTFWQFSSDEVAAFAAWVKGGGGVITLSGYDGDGDEVTPLNQLLSFTDFSYNMDGTYGNDCSSNCWGGACALTGWDASSPIGAHVTRVGIASGRSISIASDAGYASTIDCPCPGANQCAVHEDIGKGHVFSFTDEWVTYTSQWLGTSTCMPSTCTGDTPADDFQVPQFWYNAIMYASSSATCFAIQDPAIIPVVR
jgi:hypothetical protein